MGERYCRLPPLNPRYVNTRDYFLLFETNLFDRDNFTSHIFTDPIKVIKIHRYRDVARAFGDIERYAKNFYLAGYFSYELGYYFEDSLFRPKPYSAYPLIQLCVFDRRVSFNHKTGRINGNIPGLFSAKLPNRDFSIRALRFNFSREQYLRKIREIKEYIRQGETYQVNFTGRYDFNFRGSALGLYDNLRDMQNVSYGAFCKFGKEYVISLSPELFFRRCGVKVYSRPMKGTIARGRSIAEDKEKAVKLNANSKDQAENLMIVDLIRNDLGRISRVHSVKVAHLFAVEKYNTLLQMTSGIKSSLRGNTTYLEIFRSLFPGGSVTGAPKIRTMQIIRELEGGPRKIYCGALGMIFPGEKAVFNLPIRTISLIKNKGEMGVGSGIVYDSLPEAEFQECILKAKFLSSRHKEFKLVETLLWDGRYRFLKEHLGRMKDSAAYFGFSFSLRKALLGLRSAESGFKDGSSRKVRILLEKNGKLRIGHAKISGKMPPALNHIGISRHRVDPQDVFCYHKTTNRDLYDSEYRSYRARGFFDVVFLNKQGEVAEGAISNIIIEVNRKYYTPPVSCGLLPGIMRGYFIRRHNARERVIFPEDLLKADRVLLCNSVRGATEVRIKG